MSDQVEITNVGDQGGVRGVASEETLASLLETMKKMAKQQGTDTSKISKRLREFNDEIEGGVKVSRRYRDDVNRNSRANRDNTDAVNASTEAHQALTSSITGALLGTIGAAVGSLHGLASELVTGGGNVSDFARHLPLIGIQFSKFTRYFDDTFDVFRQMSKVGGGLAQDLNEVRLASADTYLSLQQFGEFVKSSSQQMASYGGTVTQGSKMLRNLHREFDTHRENLLELGFTYEDMNDQLSRYMFLNRAGRLAQVRSDREEAEAAAEYAKNLNMLSKLTGQDVDAMQEKVAEEMNQIVFQRELARMGETAQRTFNQAFTAISSTSTEMGRMMQQFLTGAAPTSEELRLMSALLPEASSGMRKFVEDIKSGDLEAGTEEFNRRQMEMISTMASSFDRFMIENEGALGSVVSSGGEIGAQLMTIVDIINNSNIDLANVIDRNGEVNMELLRERLKSARDEQGMRDKTVESAAAFDESIRSMQQTIKTAFVESGILTAFALGIEQVTDVIGSEDFQKNFKELAEGITDFTSTIVTTLESDNITEAFTDLFKEGGAFHESLGEIQDHLGNAFTSVITSDPVKYALVGGIGLLFGAALIKNAMLSGINRLFGGRESGPGGGRTGGTGRGGSRTGASVGGIGAGLASAGRVGHWILAGGAAIGAAVALMGAGIAGATWLMGKALPTLAEGMSKFEDIDGENFKDVARGMLEFSGAMAVIGASKIVNAVGDTAVIFTKALGNWLGVETESPMDMMERFAGYEFNVSQVRSNAVAMRLFGDTMSNMPNINPSVAESFRGFVSNLLGSGIMDQFKKFSEFDLNENIHSNISALAQFAGVFKDVADSDLSEVTINKDFIGGLGGLSRIGSGLGESVEHLDRLASIDNLKKNIDVLSNLDASGLKEYRSEIQGLADAMSDLNDELRRSGRERFGPGPGGRSSSSEATAASELISEINTRSNEGITQLTRLMSEVLTVIRTDAQTNEKIEKNTRNLRHDSYNISYGVTGGVN